MSIFLELFPKKQFLTIYIHISKDLNTLKNCSIDLIFFSTASRDSNKVFFFVLGVISYSKIYEAKMFKKNGISLRPYWIFGGHLGMTMGTF